MAKNLTNFDDFQNKRKSVNESKVEKVEKIENDKVNEGTLVGDMMRVPLMVDVPMSLLKAYATKVKNETGIDIKNGSIWSDSLLSDEIARYIQATYMTIENLPTSIVTGGEKAQGQVQVQPQPQLQPQPQAQTPQEVPTQGQAPVQVAPAPQTQVPQGGGQPTPQQTAQQIPAMEQ